MSKLDGDIKKIQKNPESGEKSGISDRKRFITKHSPFFAIRSRLRNHLSVSAVYYYIPTEAPSVKSRQNEFLKKV